MSVMSTVDVPYPSGLLECTPSTQLIYHLIRRHPGEEVTRSWLCETAGLSSWTVRTSIATLRDLGAVEERDDPAMPQRKLIRDAWGDSLGV